jgi:hypothetical protein
VPGFKVCVSTRCDVHTTAKSRNDAVLRTYPPHKATRDCIHGVSGRIVNILGGGSMDCSE